MGNKEAIRELEILKEDYWDDDGYGHETKQYDDTMLAIDMAIEALNQEEEKERIIKELEENFENTVEPHHFETDREEMWYEVGINVGIAKAIEIAKRGGKE